VLRNGKYYCHSFYVETTTNLFLFTPSHILFVNIMSIVVVSQLGLFKFRATRTFFPKYSTSFLCSFITLLHWKSHVMLHHKVNGPCFIFSLDNLNEWICPWLSRWRFNITRTPSLFLMGRWVVYFATLNVPLRVHFFQNVSLRFACELNNTMLSYTVYLSFATPSPPQTFIDNGSHYEEFRGHWTKWPRLYFRYKQWQKSPC